MGSATWTATVSGASTLMLSSTSEVYLAPVSNRYGDAVDRHSQSVEVAPRIHVIVHEVPSFLSRTGGGEETGEESLRRGLAGGRKRRVAALAVNEELWGIVRLQELQRAKKVGGLRGRREKRGTLKWMVARASGVEGSASRGRRMWSRRRAKSGVDSSEGE